MSNDKMFNTFKSAYFQAFTDEQQIDAIVGIVTDVRNKVWPDETLLFDGIPVGRVSAVGGFWRSKWLLQQCAQVLTGRSLRAICLAFGMDVNSKPAIELAVRMDQATNEQIERILPVIFKQLETSYGEVDPPLEREKLKAIKIDVINYMQRTFECEFEVPEEALTDDWPVSPLH
jgi:hypothetical protein